MIKSSRIAAVVVGHVGPPTGRTGGPAGYLHQLKSTAAADAHPRHDVRFPSVSSAPRPSPATSSPPQPRASALSRLRRKLFGPKFYRPPASELAHPGGVVDRMMRRMTADVCADTRPSLDSALTQADVVFTHDPFSTEA